MMDKQKDSNAAMFQQKLLRLPMNKVAGHQAKFNIIVTNVYSPLQFWFQFVESNNRYNLKGLHNQMSQFYTKESTQQLLPICPMLLLPGSICAASTEWGGWRRVRIVSEQPMNATHVSVIYMDYGCLERIACKDLRALPKQFIDIPALAVRGALSRVLPLAYMWPAQATGMFRQKVMFEQAYAQIMAEDLQEAIYFVEIYDTKKPGALSVNSWMIQHQLAAEGQQFDERPESPSVRRLRYVHERLPSFDMLETGVFPMDADRAFEEYFKGIVCSPAFTMEFMVPATTNPFLEDLHKALLHWLVGFKQKQINQSRLERNELQKAKKEKVLQGVNEQQALLQMVEKKEEREMDEMQEAPEKAKEQTESEMVDKQEEQEMAKKQKEPEKAKEQKEPKKTKEQKEPEKTKKQEEPKRAKEQQGPMKPKKQEEPEMANEQKELQNLKEQKEPKKANEQKKAEKLKEQEQEQPEKAKEQKQLEEPKKQEEPKKAKDQEEPVMPKEQVKWPNTQQQWQLTRGQRELAKELAKGQKILTDIDFTITGHKTFLETLRAKSPNKDN